MKILCIFLLCITMPSICYADKVIDTIVYESSGESLQGQLAVASVIKQRVIDRGKTALQVVLQPFQFSCWRNGKPTQKRKITARERKRAEKVWKTAKAQGYNHYHSIRIKPPRWTRKYKKKKRIGNHIFYKL